MTSFTNRTIKIINNNSEERRNITNVFGIIEGSEEPGEEYFIALQLYLMIKVHYFIS